MTNSYTSVLEDFSKNDSFLKFDKNGEIEAVFQNLIKENDPFGKDGEERLLFSFSCSDGKVRQLSSKSKRLAKSWLKAGPAVGDLIRIIRFGEKFETNYQVKILQTREQLMGIQEPSDVPTVEEVASATPEPTVNNSEIPF